MNLFLIIKNQLFLIPWIFTGLNKKKPWGGNQKTPQGKNPERFLLSYHYNTNS